MIISDQSMCNKGRFSKIRSHIQLTINHTSGIIALLHDSLQSAVTFGVSSSIDIDLILYSLALHASTYIIEN